MTSAAGLPKSWPERLGEAETSVRRFQSIWRKEAGYWLYIVSKYSEIRFEPVEVAKFFIWSKFYDKIESPIAIVVEPRLWIMSTACLHHSLGNFQRLYYSNVDERRLHTVDCPLPPALGDLEAWATGGTQVQEASWRLAIH